MKKVELTGSGDEMLTLKRMYRFFSDHVPCQSNTSNTTHTLRQEIEAVLDSRSFLFWHSWIVERRLDSRGSMIRTPCGGKSRERGKVTWNNCRTKSSISGKFVEIVLRNPTNWLLFRMVVPAYRRKRYTLCWRLSTSTSLLSLEHMPTGDCTRNGCGKRELNRRETMWQRVIYFERLVGERL